jgi:Spy/CpxP family protein refolding chaperone
MKRMRTFMTIILPSMLAGGLVFGSAFGHAAGPDLVGFWPAAGDVTTAGKRHGAPVPPPPPSAPPDRDHWAVPPAAPPAPPAPPAPVVRGSGGGHRKGVRIMMRDGVVTVEGLPDMVRGQLDAVRGALAGNTHIPQEARDKINARLDKMRALLEKRAAKMTGGHGWGDLQREMEQMGEEFERMTEGLDEELEALGSRLGKDFGKRLGKDLAKSFEFDFDDEDPRDKKDKKDKKDKRDKADKTKPPKAPSVSDSDGDDDGDDDHGGSDDDGSDDHAAHAPVDAKDMKLKPDQRADIVKLRKETERDIAAAQKELATASQRLEALLADPKTSDNDIRVAVDRVSGHEAAIRKARLVAWAKARRMLDPDQRAKIEGASRPKALKHP